MSGATPAGAAPDERCSPPSPRRASGAAYYKLVGKIFTTNGPSIALVRASGWRDVGTHERHGRLDGEWRDVLVVELLLGEARADD